MNHQPEYHQTVGQVEQYGNPALAVPFMHAPSATPSGAAKNWGGFINLGTPKTGGTMNH